jgi:monofunctional chorismate mutase
MTIPNNPEVASLREKIDAIDQTIWSLVEQRFTLTKKISKIKHDLNIPVLDAQREQAVLEKISAVTSDPEISVAISKLYELLFNLSREYQLSLLKLSAD